MNGEKPTGFRYLKVDIRLVAFDELTWPERIVIADIMSFPDGQYRKTNAGIAAMLRFTTRGVIKLVNRLVALGLVEKQVSARSKTLTMTVRFRERLESVGRVNSETQEGELRSTLQECAKSELQFTGRVNSETQESELRDMVRVNSETQEGEPQFTRRIHKNTLEKQQGKLQGDYRGGTDVPTEPEFTPSGDAKPAKRKRSQAVKPELSEVKSFAEECGASEETAEAFFDYWESIGWKKKGGQPIVDWKAAFRNWRRREDAWHKEKPARPPRGAFDINSYARAADERDDGKQVSAEQQWVNMAASIGMSTEEFFKRMKERGYTK